jgi:hypothetical protein
MSNGKGSDARPLSVSREEFASNWERTFRGQRVEEDIVALTKAMSRCSPGAPPKYVWSKGSHYEWNGTRYVQVPWREL